MTGSLVVVGTGIGAAQLTTEARAELAGADEVFFLVGDPVSEHTVLELAPSARSLADCYEEGRSRLIAYERMVETILAPARAGRKVCAAFYGHPGMLVHPSREAIGRARAEGIEARMLPGISALDCLFADLGVDPAEAGCQTYEAGDFLRRRPAVEPRAALVLWQVGVVGQATHSAAGPPRALAALVDALLESYPPEHELVVYEASPYPGVAPLVVRVGLGALDASAVSHRSTVYVPPRAPR
ncbi:MAG: methylase [Actinobacteria bacterium]|nr:methylase [Actinomycetota bacterium]